MLLYIGGSASAMDISNLLIQLNDEECTAFINITRDYFKGT